MSTATEKCTTCAITRHMESCGTSYALHINDSFLSCNRTSLNSISIISCRPTGLLDLKPAIINLAAKLAATKEETERREIKDILETKIRVNQVSSLCFGLKSKSDSNSKY